VLSPVYELTFKVYLKAKEMTDIPQTQNPAAFAETDDIFDVSDPPWENAKAIPHNSKCRYGERGAADAKPKAQIILCVLSSILATQMPCRSRRSGA